MKTPTIHRNGTGQDSLLAQQNNASELLRDAIRALEQAAPNARDYYPQGSEAFPAASKEHRARVIKLMEVRAELEAMAEVMADGGHQ